MQLSAVNLFNLNFLAGNVLEFISRVARLRGCALASEISICIGLPLPNVGQNQLLEYGITWLPQFLKDLPPGHVLTLQLEELGVFVDPGKCHSDSPSLNCRETA